MASDERSRPLLHDQSFNSVEEQPRSEVRASRFRITIEPAAFFFAVASVLYYPVIQQYLYRGISISRNHTKNESISQCSTNHSDADFILQQEIQSETSQWLIYYNIIYLGVAFFSTIFLGGYTDKAGRKIGIIAPIIGQLLSLYVLLFVMVFDVTYKVILVGALLQGMSGSYAVFLMATFSYVSDTTSSNDRSFRIILMEACLMVGAASASLSSGYLIEYVGYMGTALILHVILMFALIYVEFFIEESVIKDPNVTFWTTRHFMQSFKVYLKDNGSGRRWVLLSTMLLLFIVSNVRLGTDDVQMLFVFDAPICWSAVYFGYYKAAMYVVSSIGSLLLTKLLQKRLGDLPLVIIGCVSGAAMCVYITLADSTLMMMAVPLIGTFAMIHIGMIRAFTSKIVEPSEFGAMFAWVAWMELIGGLTGDIAFNSLYASTLVWFKGFTFLVIALGHLVALVITAIIMWRVKQMDTSHFNRVIPINVE